MLVKCASLLKPLPIAGNTGLGLQNKTIVCRLLLHTELMRRLWTRRKPVSAKSYGWGPGEDFYATADLQPDPVERDAEYAWREAWLHSKRSSKQCADHV